MEKLLYYIIVFIFITFKPIGSYKLPSVAVQYTSEEREELEKNGQPRIGSLGPPSRCPGMFCLPEVVTGPCKPIFESENQCCPIWTCNSETDEDFKENINEPPEKRLDKDTTTKKLEETNKDGGKSSMSDGNGDAVTKSPKGSYKSRVHPKALMAMKDSKEPGRNLKGKYHLPLDLPHHHRRRQSLSKDQGSPEDYDKLMRMLLERKDQKSGDSEKPNQPSTEIFKERKHDPSHSKKDNYDYKRQQYPLRDYDDIPE